MIKIIKTRQVKSEAKMEAAQEWDGATVGRLTLEHLAARARGASVCPSEVARALVRGDAHPDWRSAMPAVHDAVDRLLAAGDIHLSWKGRPLETRQGPYRIRRPSDA